jgi:hypothetical protein
MIFAAALLAEEYKGKVKEVDTEKNTLTVTIEDKDMKFEIPEDAKILNAKGKDIKDRLKGKQFQKPGTRISVTTEKKVDKEVVKEVKVLPKKDK